VQQAYSIDPVRPWRTAALVAFTVAAVELVALVAGGMAVFGYPFVRAHEQARAARSASAASARSKPPAPPRPPVLTRGQTSVLVLNANGLAGAAQAAADDVRAHHYPVAYVGNARDQTRRRSVVMYAPSLDREARRLAVELHVGQISPLDGILPAALRGARLVLLVGG
jgi:hypothetical protein